MADTENKDMGSQNATNDEEGEEPVCDVCFGTKFISDVMTTIDSCQHRFCGYCLDQWSKQHDTCPVDRLKFSKISFTNAITGEIIDKQVIKPHNSVVESESETDHEMDDDDDLEWQLYVLRNYENNVDDNAHSVPEDEDVDLVVDSVEDSQQL